MSPRIGRPVAQDLGVMTQVEVARELGVSRGYVSMVEARALRKLRAALNLTAEHPGRLR